MKTHLCTKVENFRAIQVEPRVELGRKSAAKYIIFQIFELYIYLVYICIYIDAGVMVSLTYYRFLFLQFVD